MRLAVVVAAAVLAACHPATPAPQEPISNTTTSTAVPHELMATLERSACYGTCPIYSVRIFRDGAVEYDGEDFVKVKGPATGQITPDDIVALDALFADRDYTTLNDSYTAYDMTDMPSANTSHTANGITKSIKHYHGDGSAPVVLRDIEDGIDRIVHIEQWIGTEAERDKLFR